MGTRSLTHFLDSDGDAVAYADSRIGDAGYLAARYVTFLSTQVYTDGLSVGIQAPGAKGCGEEFTYRVLHDGRVEFNTDYDGEPNNNEAQWQPLTPEVVAPVVKS